jgi:hypothetical protein
MTAQRAAESIQRGLATRHILAARAQALGLEIQVRVGETELVQRALDDMDEDTRAAGEMRVVQATLRLADEDPEGATKALAPIFDGASPVDNPRWEIQALLLKATAEDALGNTGSWACWRDTLRRSGPATSRRCRRHSRRANFACCATSPPTSALRRSRLSCSCH